MVKEKKELVLDLARCYSSYLVSVGPDRKSIIDGASQIASLALGYNDPIKNAMALRPELLDPTFNLAEWDVTQAFLKLLSEETGLSHVYLVNSGAEAIETALKACQTKYPKRRKIIAFEGSFHGRGLLSLHTTHSPAKRAQFEIFPDIVDFQRFPETKDPDHPAAEPEEWLEVWKDIKSKDFSKKLEPFLNSHDELLKVECDCLLGIRDSLRDEKPLAVLIEPMQCEGGDRYGTNRFFRALRVLTRAFDTPLVVDEVQTGFGLGRQFFWYRDFDLPEPPDAVVSAKKAQVGACITRFSMNHKIETSAASVYRGYLHASAILDSNRVEIENKISNFLNHLQTAIGDQIVQSPRGRGLCFAFDLPEKKHLDHLIKNRFKNGILFYPAGERTARFRVLTTTDWEELSHLFVAIYKCFVDLSEEEIIGKIPTLEEWLNTLPPKVKELAQQEPGVRVELPIQLQTPRTYEDFAAITSEQWIQTFSQLFRSTPQLLRSDASLETDLIQLQSIQKADLWKHYQEDRDFTLTDLLWQGARAYSYPLVRLNSDDIKARANEITRFEEAVYEPERRDDPLMFARVVDDEVGWFIGYQPEGELKAIAVTASLKHFTNIELVDTDPFNKDDRAFYSADISIHPDHRGKGLGLRLKCEQFIYALRSGAAVLRSRNRFPETQTMIRLNRALGSVVIEKNENDYDGKSTALYQSFDFYENSSEFRVLDHLLPALRNKSTLSNFISSNYINNIDLIREIFPERLRHLYLSSGRSEALDKMVKLFRRKKATGKIVLSFDSDFFGSTTAASRSLGDGEVPYFDWPKIRYSDDPECVQRLQEQIDQLGKDAILGLMIEPLGELNGKRKSPAILRSLIEQAHRHDIPVAFHETASSFYHYDPKSFFCASEEIQPDGVYLYCGGQLGMLGASKSIFLDQPLQMISTWDGDEHSLNLFKNRILKCKN